MILPVLQEIAYKGLLCLVIAVMVISVTACKTTSPFKPPAGGNVTMTNADGSTYTATAPTPAQKALALWVVAGGMLFAFGALMILPLFGGNARSGVLIAASGIAMAAVGHFLGSIQIVIPVWLLPSLIVLVVVGMLYGWSVRNKQPAILPDE